MWPPAGNETRRVLVDVLVDKMNSLIQGRIGTPESSGRSDSLVRTPNWFFMFSSRVPTKSVDRQSIPSAALALNRRANRAPTSYHQNFAEVSQYWHPTEKPRNGNPHPQWQAVCERNFRPDGLEPNFRKIWSDLPPQGWDIKMFNENAIGLITAPNRQSQQPTHKVIVLNPAHITPLVRERIGDGVVHVHPLIPRV